MIRRNVLRRVEQLELLRLPEKREVIKVVVTDPWGVIDEFEIDGGPQRRNRSLQVQRFGAQRFEIDYDNGSQQAVTPYTV